MRILRLSPFFVLALTAATTLNLSLAIAAKASTEVSTEERIKQRLFVAQGNILVQLPATTPSGNPTPTPTPTPSGFPQPVTLPTQNSGTSEPEPRVLVSEVLLTGVDGELKDLVYRTIQTTPGRSATRSQLKQDVTAIYNTGYFANIKVTPVDTPLGVRIIFDIQPNPVLKKVKLRIVPDSDAKQIIPPELLDSTFSQQYGKTLNWKDLQEGIKKINEWYSKNGYELAQIIGSPKVSEDGTVTLVLSQGIIESIEVKFFTKKE